MSARGALDRIAGALGVPDLTTGDAHFDDAVVLYGRAHADVQAFLATNALRQALRDVVSAGAVVHDGRVSWAWIGALADEPDLEERIRRTRALAAGIEAAAPRR